MTTLCDTCSYFKLKILGATYEHTVPLMPKLTVRRSLQVLWELQSITSTHET